MRASSPSIYGQRITVPPYHRTGIYPCALGHRLRATQGALSIRAADLSEVATWWPCSAAFVVKALLGRLLSVNRLVLTAGQRIVLSELQQRCVALEPGASRLVVIGGDPGTGKTAVVHALYRELVRASASSKEPLIWPDEICPEDVPRSLARKRIRPEALADPFGTMPFAWLGQSFQQTANGQSLAELDCLVSDALAQALYINANAADRDVAARTLITLLAFVSAGGASILLGSSGLAAGVAVSWSTFAYEVGRLARTILDEDEQLQAAAKRVGRIPWTSTYGRAHLLCNRIIRLSRLGIPTILALEDAHLSDEGCVDLCRALLLSDASSTLIVATADRGAIADQMERCRGFGSLLVEPIDSRYRPSTFSILPPTPSEISAVVRTVSPSIGLSAVNRITALAHSNIEFAIELAERTSLGFDLSVDTTQSDRISLLERRWDRLPLHVQRYLACVAALQGEIWLAEHTLEKLDFLPREDQLDAQQRALAEAIIVVVDSWRLGFIDRRWVQFCQGQVKHLIPSTSLLLCRRDLFDRLRSQRSDQTTWQELPLGVKATLLRTEVGLYPDPTGDELNSLGEELIIALDELAGIEALTDHYADAIRTVAQAADLIGLITANDGLVDAQLALQVRARYAYLPVASLDYADVMEEAEGFTVTMRLKHGSSSEEYLSARWNEASIHAKLGEYRHAVEIAAEAIEAGQHSVDPRTLLSWRLDHATWTGTAGRPDEAASLMRSLLSSSEELIRLDERLRPLIRNDIWFWLAEAGHTRDAIPGFRQLLHDGVIRFGQYDESVMSIRGNLANALAQEGQFDDAISQLQQLLDDRIHLLGKEHPKTLLTRNNLYTRMAEAGQVYESIDEFTVLLEEQLAVQGRDDPSTLVVRNNLALWLDAVGRHSEALAQTMELVADRTRLLGPYHPHTLASRNNMAIALLGSGRVREAVEAFEALVPDLVHVHGPDHPASLTARQNLAKNLHDLDRIDESLALYDALVVDLDRVLGPFNPGTLITRGNRAMVLGDMGRRAEALAELELLLPKMAEVFGSDNPLTFRLRSNRASCLAHAGRTEEAIEVLEGLVDDELYVLGPDHEDTFVARSNLAFHRFECGDVERAIEENEALLDDGTRTLGRGHPAVLQILDNLATICSIAGRQDEAVVLFERLLQECDESVGSEEKRYIEARGKLALALGLAGRYEERINQLRLRVDDHVRAMGTDDPATFRARDELGCALGECGRFDEALAEFLTLQADVEQLAGPSSPLTSAIRERLELTCEYRRRAKEAGTG